MQKVPDEAIRGIQPSTASSSLVMHRSITFLKPEPSGHDLKAGLGSPLKRTKYMSGILTLFYSSLVKEIV